MQPQKWPTLQVAMGMQSIAAGSMAATALALAMRARTS
jgi:hypothetical protein